MAPAAFSPHRGGGGRCCCLKARSSPLSAPNHINVPGGMEQTYILHNVHFVSDRNPKVLGRRTERLKNISFLFGKRQVVVKGPMTKSKPEDFREGSDQFRWALATPVSHMNCSQAVAKGLLTCQEKGSATVLGEAGEGAAQRFRCSQAESKPQFNQTTGCRTV